MSHIFISYSHLDSRYAQSLAEELTRRGFSVWIDYDINYGDRWFATITEAIRRSSCVVVIMTPDAEQSEWVEKEILFAQREKKPIFPLLLKGSGFPLLITSQYVDVTNGKLPPDRFYERLSSGETPPVQSNIGSGAIKNVPNRFPKRVPSWLPYLIVIMIALLLTLFFLALLGPSIGNIFTDIVDVL